MSALFAPVLGRSADKLRNSEDLSFVNRMTVWQKSTANFNWDNDFKVNRSSRLARIGV